MIPLWSVIDQIMDDQEKIYSEYGDDLFAGMKAIAEKNGITIEEYEDLINHIGDEIDKQILGWDLDRIPRTPKDIGAEMTSRWMDGFIIGIEIARLRENARD